MKKIILALSLLTLLAGCEEPVANTTPGDVEDEAHFEETSQKVMEPQPFYITALYRENETYTMEQTPVMWLSEAEGTCRNYSEYLEEESSTPSCNPNGFLLVESDVRLISQDIQAETKVYIKNLASMLGLDSTEADQEGNYEITLEELVAAFEEYPDFFAVTPFELEFGTVTVDGIEMSDQITAIKEIYIP